jgi:hypothetical protein
LIKKGTKNQIALNADFYKLALDDNNNAFIIQLDENDDASLIKKDKEKIINKINSLKNELNQVNNLMQYIDEKLLLYENNNNLKNDSKKQLNINIKKNKRKKNLFSVVNIKDNNKQQNKENIFPNIINNADEIIKRDENIEKVNDLIFNNNKEKKDFNMKGEENSLFISKEYYDIFPNKNEIKFVTKRKDSNFSDYIIEEKMNKFNYN